MYNKSVTTSRLCIVLLLTCWMNVTALATDSSQFGVIGFSKDGKYFAFERYGTYDGSAFPYSEIFFLDICKNDYANSPMRLVLEDDGGDEEQARARNLKNAKPILDRLGIDISIKGTMMLNDATEEKIVPVRYNGQEMTLKLETFATGVQDCWQDRGEMKFTLSLVRNGVTTILQKDTKVPKSRSCAFSYWLHGVVCYNSAIVGIVSYAAPGFEGPDTRQIAVSGCIN